MLYFMIYMNYMDFYGIEGQTIINANNNSVIYTAAQMNNKKFVDNLFDTASYIGNTNELANYLSDQGADYEAIVNYVFEDEELQNSILNYLAEWFFYN